ncbi:formate dehydrogenase accessory sulfurtransferase FdhD [Aquabacterium lacunae]|uniref:Sulfur carrier protein FdhD n=1 Tax=Aquabacterium lacunae TaxID=2528630 RepID=A0A4Q9GX08_9BURK|nr:formate dehydrogenase accessory sulfurtransferase FdhD [Aquabacterium lacunae]TBO27865.1 formate dehydrogenase accessory sulfurtransferase FdhD [Aquabacterium lacunae]
MAVLAPPGLSPALVQRHTQGACQQADDWLIDEQPVALVFNGLSHVVMMATPWQLDELAVGFALSEGLIDSLDALRGVEVEAAPDGLGHSVQLEVSPRAFEQIKSRRRQLEGRSGCGLCGIDSLQAFRQAWPRAAQPNATQIIPRLNTEAVQRAVRALPDWQPLQARSGGCHAAAWCSPEGQVLWAREDVGRHNALDKLIGALALQHPQPAVPHREGFVLVSSRASYEMVSKCARAGLPALAAVSAPTALAVQLAHHSGLQLMGFCRPGSAVAYA